MFARIRQFFSRSKKAAAANDKTATATAGQAEGEEQDATDLSGALPEDPQSAKAWLALGLDGSLSQSTPEGLRGPIGEPVYNTVQRLKDWTEHRELRVKILTPRAATPEGAQAVRDWLKAHDLPALQVTNKKDLNMVEFWSVRSVQVISNTGQAVGFSPAGLDKPAGAAAAASAADAQPQAPATDAASATATAAENR